MCFQCTKTSAGRSEKRQKTTPGPSLPKPIPASTAGQPAPPLETNVALKKDVNNENVFVTKAQTPSKEEKSDEPLHIKVPPPRIMKAKRPMKVVRSSRDPAYKTLEPNMSDWESAKIMKRDELTADNLDKKCFEDNDQNELVLQHNLS